MSRTVKHVIILIAHYTDTHTYMQTEVLCIFWIAVRRQYTRLIPKSQICVAMIHDKIKKNFFYTDKRIWNTCLYFFMFFDNGTYHNLCDPSPRSFFVQNEEMNECNSKSPTVYEEIFEKWLHLTMCVSKYLGVCVCVCKYIKNMVLMCVKL